MIINEKGQSEIEFILIMILIGIIICFAVWIVGDRIKEKQFDAKVDQHLVVITGFAIPIGVESVSTPASTNVFDVPVLSGSGLSDHPRSLTLDRCAEAHLKPGMKNLYAAAPSDVAALIKVQMPVEGSSTVIICGPKGASTEVYLWAD